MEMPIADLIDKFTITKLKLERLPQNDTIIEIFSILFAEVDKTLENLEPKVREQVKLKMEELYVQNGETWKIESAIRQGKLDKEENYVEIGKRTLLIRDSNKKRVKIKNEISLIVGQVSSIDIKVDHMSEEE